MALLLQLYTPNLDRDKNRIRFLQHCCIANDIPDNLFRFIESFLRKNGDIPGPLKENCEGGYGEGEGGLQTQVQGHQ